MIQDSMQIKTNEAKTLMVDTWTERGVQGKDTKVQQRLAKIGSIVLQGYHAAIADEDLAAIAPKINQIDAELRGFAYEGVGMALAQRDFLTPSHQNRLAVFASGEGAAYHNWIYVGLGLILARARLPIEPHLAKLTPAKGWLLVDGYGYYQGMFHWRDSLNGQAIPRHISGYARHVFDQGLGRSIWFASGGDVSCISRTLELFPATRKEDLWGGVGYACAYAGGAERETIEALQIAAGAYRFQLAQGAAYAAKARHCLGNQSIYTELACEVLWGMGVDAVAQLIDKHVESIPEHGITPEPEVWQHYRAHVPHPVKSLVLV